MQNKVVVRTITDLSYAGEILKDYHKENVSGILLKPSPNSEIRIWFPEEEIQCVITPDGKKVEGLELKAWM
jgi:hypothetical protein